MPVDVYIETDFVTDFGGIEVKPLEIHSQGQTWHCKCHRAPDDFLSIILKKAVERTNFYIMEKPCPVFMCRISGLKIKLESGLKGIQIAGQRSAVGSGEDVVETDF